MRLIFSNQLNGRFCIKTFWWYLKFCCMFLISKIGGLSELLRKIKNHFSINIKRHILLYFLCSISDILWHNYSMHSSKIHKSHNKRKIKNHFRINIKRHILLYFLCSISDILWHNYSMHRSKIT